MRRRRTVRRADSRCGAAAAVKTFGGIDVLVNNASAIDLSGTLQTSMKRFDLMHQINTRGTFACSQACLPHLLKADNPHILNLSPPLNFVEKWFSPHVAYSIAKYGMSLCVLGMAGEFREAGIAVNALWPRTVIATAAVQNLLGGDAVVRGSRTPDIVADAAYAILTRASRDVHRQLLHRRRGAPGRRYERFLEVSDRARSGPHSGLLRLICEW